MEIFRAALALILRSMVVTARWAGQWRLLCLRQAAAAEGEVVELRAELMGVRDENHQLKSENSLLKSRLRQASRKRRYSPMQRLQLPRASWGTGPAGPRAAGRRPGRSQG